ncbi:MAG: hypothetical protein ABJZ55_17970 [Fuerstiella sp.]
MKNSILLGVLACSFFTGCSSARYVMKDASQGTIAIAGPTDGNWEKAHELMTQHFPSGYTVVKEEEVPVGVSTHVHKHESGNKSIVTKDKTEYHVHYVATTADSNSLAKSTAATNNIRTVSGTTMQMK